MEVIMMRSAPRFPALDEWARMSEVEQDTLIARIEAARRWKSRRGYALACGILLVALAFAAYVWITAGHWQFVTMTTSRALNRDDAKQRPESYFDSPLDIVSEPLLTRGEKLATLERWRLMVAEQLNASGEGMRTQGYSAEQARTLDLIQQARAQLSPE
jgi:hypothetical protein